METFETAYGEKIQIISCEHHRNGVGGAPFWAFIFRSEEGGGLMSGTLFEEEGHCAVYNLEKLSNQNIAFGDNSFRGDVYEVALRRFLKTNNRVED